VPESFAVTSPEGVTVATAALSDIHVASALTSINEPSAIRATAVSCELCPIASGPAAAVPPPMLICCTVSDARVAARSAGAAGFDR